MDDDLPAMQSIQQGQESGLIELMHTYREPIFRLAYRYVHSEADAADLTQTTFLKVWQKAAQFRPKGKVKSWIFSIAANLCRDHLRRQKYRQRTILAPAQEIPQQSAQGTSPSHERPSHQLQTAESIQAIEAAIDHLPEKLRFPFVFCVLEDHAYDECAQIIGGSRKTVETRIYRARKRLREKLSDLFQKT
jgi:RNA polymerase sigma-70 factor (ECF subfamily)